MKYQQERRVFNRLKKDIQPQTQLEYECAFNTLIERYNTTVKENRFLTGGAIEVFTCALLRSVGIDCSLYGSQSTHGDILLPNKKLLSIKGVFTGGAHNVILMNKQGGGIREWTTPTLFVVSEVGIVYGTPDMVTTTNIHDRTDAVLLHKKGLLEIINNKNNVLPMNLKRKPPTEMAGFAHRASVAVAKQILLETKSQMLFSMFISKEELNPNEII